MTTTRRVSVTLDLPDQQAVDLFADPARPEHATLEAWAEARGLVMRDDSDSAVVRTLLRAGAEALREKALEEGYERLAASREDTAKERRGRRDRVLARKGE
ncbi:hypothetical protein [Amycolatopsis sp. NPDC004079]|uniref:hypothetical protein n=1 Tax=Amycolatopsis sp. NPDC004079 TaxID=3154549 RepID=UPI0033B62EDD